jgi:outer membrane protein assembly factor BamB
MSAPRRSSAVLVGGILTTLALTPARAGQPDAKGPPRGDKGVPEKTLGEGLWSQLVVRSRDADRWLSRAAQMLRRNGEPVLPSFFPVVVKVPPRDPDKDKRAPRELVIYRSNWGIHAVDMRTGKLFWETPSKWSLDRMAARDYGSSLLLQRWMHFHLAQGGEEWGARPAVVFENSTVGTLSKDETLLYAVEDFQVPPHPLSPLGGADPGVVIWGQAMRAPLSVIDAARHNQLQAFEITTGKLKWELGDPDQKDGFADCVFLGPPLPLDGKVYALADRTSKAGDRETPETRLLCLDPNSQGKLVSAHTIATWPDPESAGSHRWRAAPLVLGGGLIVCQTNAGIIATFDPVAGKVAWSYRYRNERDEPQKPAAGKERPARPRWLPPSECRTYDPDAGRQWKVAPPVVARDAVVFAAPDGLAVCCLGLRDGKLRWQSPRRDGDLYLGAVVGDTVMIVGKKSVRGLRLATGEKAWEVATGLPSGRGAARDGAYYLPLQEGAASGEPEIVAVEPASGRVTGRYRLPGKEAPGNLIFSGDRVVSRTLWNIAAYPWPAGKPGP